MEKILLWFVTIGVAWLMGWKFEDLYKKDLKGVGRFFRAGRLRKNATRNISIAIANVLDREDKVRLFDLPSDYETIPFQSGGCVARINEFVRCKIMPNLIEHQEFFDQLLKRYADNLQRAYDDEESVRRITRGPVRSDSCSRREMAVFHLRKREVQERKDLAEKEFWDLHDTLASLGLETWGGDSYKAYVMLEPISFSETLKS